MSFNSYNFTGQELSGVTFNSEFNDFICVKLTNQVENHNLYQFCDGLNIDNVPFDPSGECSKGGIYFIEEQYIDYWTKYNDKRMEHVRDVIIPEDARVYVESTKFKTDKLILGPKLSIILRRVMIKLRKDPTLLFTIDHRQIQLLKEFCSSLVKYDRFMIIRVPSCLRDENMYRQVMIDRETCLILVRRDGLILEHVPETMKDKEICMTALKGNYLALEHIPDSIKDREMYMIALHNNVNAFTFVPDDIKDKDMCVFVVEKDICQLENVPISLRDKEICTIVLNICSVFKQHYYLFKLIPNNIDIKDIFMTMLDSNIDMFRYIPDHFKDKDMCMKVIKKDIMLLSFVPTSLRDKEMYMDAVKKNSTLLSIVPHEFIDKEMCMEAVKKNGDVLPFVPENMKDDRICMYAVHQNIDALIYIPTHRHRHILNLVFISFNY